MASIFTFLHKVGFHIDASRPVLDLLVVLGRIDQSAHLGKILKDLVDLCRINYATSLVSQLILPILAQGYILKLYQRVLYDRV